MKWQLLIFSLGLCSISCSHKHTENLRQSIVATSDSTGNKSFHHEVIELDSVFVCQHFFDVLDCDSQAHLPLYVDGQTIFPTSGKRYRGRPAGCNTKELLKPVLVRKKIIRDDKIENGSSSTAADYKSTSVSEVRESKSSWKSWLGWILLFVVIIGLFVDFVWRSRR